MDSGDYARNTTARVPKLIDDDELMCCGRLCIAIDEIMGGLLCEPSVWSMGRERLLVYNIADAYLQCTCTPNTH